LCFLGPGTMANWGGPGGGPNGPPPRNFSPVGAGPPATRVVGGAELSTPGFWEGFEGWGPFGGARKLPPPPRPRPFWKKGLLTRSPNLLAPRRFFFVGGFFFFPPRPESPPPPTTPPPTAWFFCGHRPTPMLGGWGWVGGGGGLWTVFYSMGGTSLGGFFFSRPPGNPFAPLPRDHLGTLWGGGFPPTPRTQEKKKSPG